MLRITDRELAKRETRRALILDYTCPDCLCETVRHLSFEARMPRQEWFKCFECGQIMGVTRRRAEG